MGYYNEMFIEKDSKLIHVASCSGSDTPCHFEKVESIKNWESVLDDLKKDVGFWPHSNKHPFPWETYKTSDHLIVLIKTKRKWFDFISPSYEAWVSVDKHKIEDENSSYFIKAKYWRGEIDYDKEKLIILEFPKLHRGY